MNNIQKKILIAAACVVVLMLLFPPFQASDPRGRRAVNQNLGYSFIASPPILAIEYRPVYGTVNIGLLCVQWVGVIIVCVGLILMTKK
jgi:hypothetical protein